MNLLRPVIQRLFQPRPAVKPLPSGVYHYQAPPDAPFPYRMHLRIEPDGNGVLMVNASTVVHLNNTATEYAYHLVQNTPEEQVVAEIARRYTVKKETIRKDYQELVDRLRTLVEVPDLDPVTYLDFDRSDPYSGALSAPYRLDCAITYQLPESESEGMLAPLHRVKNELSESDWVSILNKAWKAGVPQVIFTGGEPTLRPELPALIAHAESLGMVAGLLTDGLALSDPSFLQKLLQAGLDHILFVLDTDKFLSENEDTLQALRNTLAADIAVTVHLTLTNSSHGRERFTEIIDRLATAGVQNVSLSATSLDLKEELAQQRQALADRHIRLVWDLPTPYSHLHPVAIEMADSDPTDRNPWAEGAGRAWLYVEPDGDVLPGQGYYQDVLGNLTDDTWESIWQNARNWTDRANQERLLRGA